MGTCNYGAVSSECPEMQGFRPSFREIDDMQDQSDSAARENPRKFDHASTLPRASALCDPNQASVYFIAGAGLIKIGCTTNIVSRFRTIKNSSPVPVEMLGTRAGGTLEEGLTHQRFAHLRRHGEWFEDTPELRAHIARVIR